ncbi:TPA: DUF551 domain-containing protein [Escherichia coli]
MTKSTITRERLEELAAGQSGFNLRIATLEESQQLASMALAAMDSKPVAEVLSNRPGNDTSTIDRALPVGTQLYRHAQPAPVAPEEKSIPNTLSMYAVDAVAAIAEVKGWNACRAAMLQELKKSAGTEAICRSDENVQVLHTKSPAQSDCRPAQNHVSPAQNQGWIPVSERIPDNTEPVLCIEKRADFGTYGQPFVCWHDGGGWVGKTNYRPIVTHWMPLPAAPQEVK